MNALVLWAAQVFAAESAALTVSVTNLRNSEGVALVCVWTDKAGFPADPTQAHQCLRGPIQDRAAIVAFGELPVGAVAVSVIHDEDLDGALGTTLLLPSEGVGASIGPDYRRLGPPRFSDAVFVLVGGTNKRAVAVTYLL